MPELLIKNNICELIGSEEDFSFRTLLRYCLTMKETKRQMKFYGRSRRLETVKIDTPLYTKTSNGHYTFPRGLYELVVSEIERIYPSISIVDNSTSEYYLDPQEILKIDVKKILQPYAPFDLRKDQILATQKSLISHRGVIQVPTGGGKTEIMSAIIRVLIDRFPGIKIVVIEPTDVLVNKTKDRFNKYNLNAVRYKDIRHNEEAPFNVLVSHPTSLIHDAEAGDELLTHMSVVLWDECQHCKCDTWKTLNYLLRNCEYSLGFSALAVQEKNLYETDIHKLSAEEALVLGASGKVIVYVPPKYYIDNGILATPVVVQLQNDIDSKLSKVDNWSKLRKEGLQSKERTELTADAIAMFHGYDRRTLVLVDTKQQAFDIAKILAKKHELNVYTCVSFGSGESYTLDVEGEAVGYQGEDIVSDFDNNEFSIILSTSHMDEGVDLSNLDVAVLASGGKKDRRIVQRIGRALRNNKTGKYAYIVDFYDKGSGILEHHSKLRMNLFKKVIQIPRDLIFEKTNIEEFEGYFKKLEGLDA